MEKCCLKIDINLRKGDKVAYYLKDSKAVTSFYQIIKWKYGSRFWYI